MQSYALYFISLLNSFRSMMGGTMKYENLWKMLDLRLGFIHEESMTLNHAIFDIIQKPHIHVLTFSLSFFPI